ncbi:hypothetical protein DD630_25600 [Streptomyces sp. BSE7F]|nr:hypothetical protein DD630_25600 [Streptomyces sp. BSE7F]
MQSTGSALPVVEARSRLLAAYVTGRLSRPSRDRMLASVTAEPHAARERWGDRRPHMRIDVDSTCARWRGTWRACGGRRRSRGCGRRPAGGGRRAAGGG